MEPLFKGTCTALVTPFRLDFLNLELFDILLERQIQAGVKAVVVSGTTGESAALTDDEKMTLVRRAVETSRGRCLIIAGTGSNSTSHSLELSKRASDEGADALLLVSPYYNKASSDGLIKHYTAIADSVPVPCILYNVPSRTGLDIPVSVYKALSDHEQICGVKEASNDITKIARIRQACGDRFSIWSGNDDQAVPVMALGGNGVISVASNLYPETMVELTDLCLHGRFREAGALQCALSPIIDMLFSEVNPIPVKKALSLLGYDAGIPRLPLTELHGEKLEVMKTILGIP